MESDLHRFPLRSAYEGVESFLGAIPIRYLTPTKIMLFVLTAALACSLTVAGRAEVVSNPDPTPAFSPAVQAKADLGVYDPNRAFDSAANIRYEQIWADWSRNSAASVLVRLQAITSKGRTPILSIEPSPISTIGKEKSLLGDRYGWEIRFRNPGLCRCRKGGRFDGNRALGAGNGAEYR
jgi:hypothetical protein